MTLLSESQLDVVMSVMAFIAVFIAVMVFVRLKIKLSKQNEKIDINKNEDYVIKSVLSKHLAKLDKIVSSMGELKARLDLLEGHNSFGMSDMPLSAPTRVIPSVTDTHTERYENFPEFKTDISGKVHRNRISDITSQDLANNKSHKYIINNNVDSDSHLDIKYSYSIRRETSIYILKLLQEAPRSAREIQHNVGKTREHISRLMKKLYDEGLVDRNMSTKPFVYKITDEGRKLLE
jgi:DNA-binding transcriptional ArsR family regulator